MGPAPLLPGAKGWREVHRSQVGELAFDPQPRVEGDHRRVCEGVHDHICQCSTNEECRAEPGTGGRQGVKGGIKEHVNKSGWMSRSEGFWGWGVQRAEGRREAKL